MKRLIPLAILTLAATLSFAQGHGGPKFRFAGSDGGSLVQLAERPDVQKELNLTEEQKVKMTDLENRMQAQVTADFEKVEKDKIEDPDTIRNLIGSTGDKFATELPDILNADQQKRLRELMIQRVGYSALSRKDVQEDLALTDDQKAKVKAAGVALLAAFDKIQATDQDDPKKFREDAKAAMETRTETLKNILTEEQATKFEVMKGKPFTFETEKKG